MDLAGNPTNVGKRMSDDKLTRTQNLPGGKRDPDREQIEFYSVREEKLIGSCFTDPFDAVIIDRDYDPAFAEKHATGSSTWPNDKEIVQVAKDCFDAVLKPHGVVIIFDKKGLTLKGAEYEQIWHVGVTISGGSQDTRVYSVWRKTYNQKEFYPDCRTRPEN